jgi:membrane protein implicated in regulation of membrane protease activity
MQGGARLAVVALVALAESVAAAATAFNVLMIVATIATLSLALAAIARGMRQSRGRQGKGFVGVECLRGRREFLQDQLIPDLVEGQERHATRDDGMKMIVLLVQPPKNIEDKIVVRDGASEAS